MLLAECAACGETLAHDAPRCVRCLTRYCALQRFEEARSLLRNTMPVVRRVLGEVNNTTLRMRWYYARTLYEKTAATLDDLREAVTTLEDVAPIARRVLGGAHPVTVEIEESLQNAQAALSAALRARERPPARADAIDAR